MVTYNFTGEEFPPDIPAHMRTEEFHDIVVTSIVGTRDGIDLSAKYLEQIYPDSSMKVLFDNAQFRGHGLEVFENGKSKRIAIYELLVVRKKEVSLV